MNDGAEQLSERVVYAVAEVLGKDPMELPPLERTIGGDELDYLFHRKDHPPGAYTVFPYCDLWVVAHSTGSVDVFETYHATTAAEQLPDGVSEPTPDDRLVVFHFENERYTFYEDELDALHRIISAADDSDEAWEDTRAYARHRDE